MSWDALLRGVQAGIQNYDTSKQQQADQAQKDRDNAARRLQLMLAQRADARAADQAATERASWSPGTPDIMSNLPPEPTMGPPSEGDMPTTTETVTQKGSSAGINYQKAQSDMALQKAQADALSGKKPLDINQTFHTYDEDIPMNEYDASGKVVPRTKADVDADVTRAYQRWLNGQAEGRTPTDKPPITEKEALIFDANGKAIYANGQLLGPTLDDAASKAAAGYNWSTLKADVNSGKIKGSDLDKALNNMASTVLGAIKMTDPSRKAEYVAAIKKYLLDTINAPADQPAPGPAAKQPGMGEALAASSPQIPDTLDVNSMEPGIYRLAQALQALGTTNDAEKKTIADTLAATSKGHLQGAPFLMEQLKKIAKRNNYTGPATP